MNILIPITDTEVEERVEVFGARVHNLKNIDVALPRNKLVVITGLSGSGKSSLAFDTIYAEGQRRYIETFSAYARRFLGTTERPDVDQITGLSPVISIEQKTIGRNPRSTVGTITEIYDFLRLLYARASEAFSYETGERMVQYDEDQITALISEAYKNDKIALLAPLIRGRKGHYRELFEQLAKQGYLRARVDGEIVEITPNLKLDRYKIHDIELVVDRLNGASEDLQRLRGSVNTALEMGQGAMMVYRMDDSAIRHFSKHLMCPTTGISYPPPEPNLFSFNSPYGVCSMCNGMGEISEVDRKKIIPDDKKSVRQGGLSPMGKYKNNWFFRQVAALLGKYDFDLDTPIRDIDDELIEKLLHGTEETLKVEGEYGRSEYSVNFEGLVRFIERQADESSSRPIRRWATSFMNRVTCPQCEGARLRKEALQFKIEGLNIAEVSSLSIEAFDEWIRGIAKHFDAKRKRIARDIITEIESRSGFIRDVGLTYLSLDRGARTLSGGEAQRIRLATQIGSQLVGVLYILDEPSIGLHQRDNHKLIDSLKALREPGNSVIVVEHDRDMILAADYVIDMGPRAGEHGGRVVSAGTVDEIMASDSLTADYLNGRKKIEVPKQRRKGTGKKLRITKASGHNLKSINVDFPLGKFICVTGVSGSGKSTLIDDTLYPILNSHIYKGVKKPLPYVKATGLDLIDKVIEIDQSPIGRTPRSNPATYTGVFTDIRNLFSALTSREGDAKPAKGPECEPSR